MDVKTFSQLFVHRSDIFAIQQPRGTYIPIKEDIDDAVIQAHLDGTQTIGLYQVLPVKNTVKWAVLDIDIKKEVYSKPNFTLDDWQPKLMQQAQIAKDRFKQHDITGYIEFSGFKGYHVWAFFSEPVSAHEVKVGMEAIFKDMTPVDSGLAWEIFPKQSQLTEDGLGNLVKGPCGYHHKAKGFSSFTDEVKLENIQYADVSYFTRTGAAFMEILNKCSATKKMWDTCLEQGNAPNFAREAFAYLFLNTEGGRDFFHNSFLAKLENYDAKTTKYHLDRMENKIRTDSKRKGYIPITCKALQSEKYGNMCPQKCEAIGFAKSPIAFYHWATSESEAETKATNKLDFLFKSGNAYYERIPSDKKGAPKIKQISSFVINLDEHLKITDGLQNASRYTGHIKKDNFEQEFKLDSDSYAHDEKFKAAIYALLGPNNLLIDSITKVRDAINKYSETTKINVLKRFGYNELEDGALYPTKYRSPSIIVTKNGVVPNTDIKVDLSDEEIAKFLDLVIISDKEFLMLKKHIREDLLKLAEKEVTYSALAHTLLPIIYPFLTGDKTRYALFIRGESGKGKSFLMTHFQNFYGKFEHLASWSSTTNALGRIGYFFNDALYVVDDFKKRVFKSGHSYDLALTFLQNYADNTARSRMTQTLETAPTYVVKGWLAATGEDTPSTEASNLARLIPITHRSARRDMVRGRRVEQQSSRYAGFTARYIHKILNTNPVIINKRLLDYSNIFFPIIEGRSNDVRVARNIALLATSFYFVSEFLWSKKEAEQKQEIFTEILSTKVLKVVSEAAGELSSQRFIEVLKVLLSTGRVRFQHDYIDDVDDVQYVPIIGYLGSRGNNNNVPHIIMAAAYNEVQKFLRSSGEPLSHTRKAVLSELFENGLTYDEKETPRKFNNRNVRIIRFQPGVLE